MTKKKNSRELLQKASEALGVKRKKFPDFRVGDTVRVFVRVQEGSKSRIQPYEGLVIKRKNNVSFTVRKMASGIGVERVFPYDSPVIDKVVLISRGQVRRARLYYLRNLRGRKGRIRSELVFDKGGSDKPTPDPEKDTSETTPNPEQEPKAAQG